MVTDGAVVGMARGPPKGITDDAVCNPPYATFNTSLVLLVFPISPTLPLPPFVSQGMDRAAAEVMWTTVAVH